jgi:hypothetical protein
MRSRAQSRVLFGHRIGTGTAKPDWETELTTRILLHPPTSYMNWTYNVNRSVLLLMFLLIMINLSELIIALYLCSLHGHEDANQPC